MTKEQIIVFLSNDEKELITNKAQNMNISVNQFMLLAANKYNHEEEEVMVEILDNISSSISVSIDKALTHVKESNSRIEKMEQSALINKVSAQLKGAIISSKKANQHLENTIKAVDRKKQ